MEPSLYIHIPFCRRKCVYCDFCSVIYDSSIASRYIDAVSRQVEDLNRKFYTIYVGGGFVTVLDKTLLGKLLKSINKYTDEVAEFTIEANPESLDEDKIKLFLDSGVDRISIGVQSVNEKKLKKLGRVHDVKKDHRCGANWP